MARWIETLIAAGHPPDAVWDYSPRQTYAFLILAHHRHKEEDSRSMLNAFIGHNADSKNLDEIRKDLLKGF